MQPIVGALSDKCTSRWGRRRPFLVGGSVIVIINLASIGWTRDIMDALIGHSDESAVSLVFRWTHIRAIVFNAWFSINAGLLAWLLHPFMF